MAILAFVLLQPRAIPVALAATYTVNSTVDGVDFDGGVGVCETGLGNGICTLRAAIQTTNDFSDLITQNGLTQLLGAEGRYDLISRWEIVAQASLLTALHAGTTDYGVGSSLSCRLMENTLLSFGYNLHGLENYDFYQGDFTAQGLFVKFRLKCDQQTLKDLLLI